MTVITGLTVVTGGATVILETAVTTVTVEIGLKVVTGRAINMIL